MPRPRQKSRWVSHRAPPALTIRPISISCGERCAGIIVNEDLTQEGLRIYTSLEPRAQEEAEHALDHELDRLDHSRKYPDAKLEGAVVVTSPQSGDVIAIVGSRNVGYDGFNRDAGRAPGRLDRWSSRLFI